MSMNEFYSEDHIGNGNSSRKAINNMYNRMANKLNEYHMNPFRNVSDIVGSKDLMSVMTEAAKIDVKDADPTKLNEMQLSDIEAINTLQNNTAKEILNEAATMGIENISPIVVNSFGIQERALIGTHLPRAVKQVTAKVDHFKLTERKPYIIDIAGNRRYFIDAFLPDSNITDNLNETKTLTAEMNATNLDLYTTLSVDTKRIFGFDSSVTGFTIKDASDNTKTVPAASISFGPYAIRTPNVENGQFSVPIVWKDLASATHTAQISGQFDLKNGKLLYLSSTDQNITQVIFEIVLSPETHDKALQVGYDIKQTPVDIPIGPHVEYNISEEFKDASDKYYKTDAMALLTDYMGKAVEQIKDCVTLKKFQSLEDVAIFKGKFNCIPPTGFNLGKEEHLKREFCPYIEQICILLKNQTRIENCHFRVAGNPMDIRVAASKDTNYIYQKNQEFMGDITLDYDFSVTTNVHKIFYLSSERIPQGKIYIFLIPNTIENNISTVNHYEYATYISNKYRGTNSNLPTVMISTRYLTQEYFPVLATIEMDHNNPANVTSTGDDLIV